jgi:hypothetical protein
MKYMIEFSPSDSSYTESIFGQKGRISYVPPDSVIMAPARLSFHNRNNQFLEYNISVSDTVMNLTVPSGQPAQKLTRLTSFTNEGTDTFTLFMLCFEEFLFPKNNQVIDSIANLVIGKHAATHSAAVLFKSDTLFMGVLQTETKETWLVLLDTKKKSMLEYRRVWDSDDATCTNTFDYHPGQMPTIIQRIACKGKQLVIRRFAVNPDGQLFLIEQ